MSILAFPDDYLKDGVMGDSPVDVPMEAST